MSTLGPFLGINNRLPDSRLLVQDKGQWLRQAYNVDIDDAGVTRRRTGAELAASLTDAHSLWSNGARTFFVRAGALREATTLASLVSVSCGTLASDARMSYTDVGGDVYFSNGTDSGRIAAGASSATPWALATPASLGATPNGSGTLPPGSYQITLTYATAAGEEGGALPSVVATLATTGGFTLTLPGASPGADYVNIYMSATHGETPTWYSRVAASATSTTITALPTKRPVPNNLMLPQPAGQIVASLNSRLLVATGPILTYSPPWNLGLYLPSAGHIPFPADITNVAPCIDGAYVTADRTYWVSGADVMQAEVIPTMPYGAVPGTAFSLPQTQQVGWFGLRGVVVADKTGQAAAIQEAAVAVDTAASGATLVREVGGVRSVVVSLAGTPTTPALVAPGVVAGSAGRLHENTVPSGLTTYCVNLTNNATSQYENFDFNSMALAHDGDYYALTSTGLFRLGGDTDNGALIDAMVSFGVQDLGTDNLKILPVVYLSVASTTLMMLRVGADGVYYEFKARTSSEELTTQRVDVARGLRASVFDLGVYNTDGGDFSLYSVRADAVKSKRRI